MVTALLVAVISAGSGIVIALISNGRHTKEIRRQISPTDTDTTIAALFEENQRELTALTVEFAQHDIDNQRHRGPRRNVS